jgi:hypothetical protein
MAKQYSTRGCECTAEMWPGQKRPDRCEEHGNRFQTAAELKPRDRAPLAKVSQERQAEEDAGTRPRRRNSTLNPGRGFSVAKPQRAKLKGLVCVGCGRDVEDDPNWTLDPAHLWPRRFGGCGHKLCVVPLCRHLYITDQGCHLLYDAGKLDIHGKLVDRGYFKEMAHAIEAHEVSPLTLVNRLTGEEHVPKRAAQTSKAGAV